MIRGLVGIPGSQPSWFRAVCDKCGIAGKNIEQTAKKAETAMLTMPHAADCWKKIGTSLVCNDCAAELEQPDVIVAEKPELERPEVGV